MKPGSLTIGRLVLAAAALTAGMRGTAHASGMSFIDHQVAEDASGVWAAAKSPDFPAGLTALTAAGAFCFVRKRKTPFILSLLPDGVAVGLRYRFR